MTLNAYNKLLNIHLKLGSRGFGTAEHSGLFVGDIQRFDQ